MNLNDVCRKIALKELGKPGMIVERMLDPNGYLKKGKISKVVRVHSNMLILTDKSGRLPFYDPRYFRKVLNQESC